MFALFACTLCAALASPAQGIDPGAQDPPAAEVIVTVLDPDGVPAAGIRVTCSSSPKEREGQMLRTDQDGVAEFLVKPGDDLSFQAWTDMTMEGFLLGNETLPPLREDDVRSVTIRLQQPAPPRLTVSIDDADSGKTLEGAKVAFVNPQRDGHTWDMRERTPFGSVGFIGVQQLENTGPGLFEGATRPTQHQEFAVLCDGYALHIERIPYRGPFALDNRAIERSVSLRPELAVTARVADLAHHARLFVVTQRFLSDEWVGRRDWMMSVPAERIDDGFVRFSHVPNGVDAFVISVRHGRIESMEKLPAELSPGAGVRVAIELKPDQRIHGTVRTRTGKPLSGQTVELRRPFSGIPALDSLLEADGLVATAKTTPSGSFELSAVIRGSYVIALAAPAEDEETPWEAIPVELEGNADLEGVNLIAGSPAAEMAAEDAFDVEGSATLVASAKKNGEGRACPVKAMLIRRSDGATLNSALAGPSKTRIVFGRLAVDDYSLVAVARGGWISEPTDVSLNAGKDPQWCPIELRRGATLRIDCGAVDRSVQITVRTANGIEYTQVIEGTSSTITIPAGSVLIEAQEIGGRSNAQWTLEAAAGETIEKTMPPTGD